jgi:hypothetical protein
LIALIGTKLLANLTKFFGFTTLLTKNTINIAHFSENLRNFAYLFPLCFSADAENEAPVTRSNTHWPTKKTLPDV